MARHATDRRTVLIAAGATVASALSGCSNVTSELPGADDGSDGPNEDELRAAIEAYFDAGTDGDVEAFAEAVHPESPMHPEHWEGSDWELTLEDGEAPDRVDIESVTADAAVDEVLALEYADQWYQPDELEDAIGSEAIALVECSTETLETEEMDVWALVTDDGDWKVLFGSTEDDTPENPEAVFEPEIRDDGNDVVAEVDWDWNRNDTGEDAVDEDAEWARVVLTETPGREADTVRIESTIAGTEVEFYEEQTENASTAWAGSWGSVQLHPEGDQIVVGAIDDGEETVVHRVHYEP